VATLAALSERLRFELGDQGKSFVETFKGDGSTTRFNLTTSPVDGATMVVRVGSTNVSGTTSVEERTGLVVLASPPNDGAIVTVSGTTFKYFTTAEINEYVNTAFLEHANSTTDTNGSRATMLTLPVVEEYPMILLATSMALYTLATDASFDIDIISPDGVSIPRTERFRQLTDIITQRKEQYRELCNLLGIGLYKIEVFNLRRISRLTNKLVPIYRPQEIDDASLPQRVRLSIPDYGDVTPQGDVITRDLSMYAGDDFAVKLKFSMDLATYTPKSQLRLFHTGGRAQVGPVIVGEFVITKLQSTGSGIYDTIQLALAGSITKDLPYACYYDVQLTNSADGKTRTFMTGKVFTEQQVTL
jgi:hypothetical protein